MEGRGNADLVLAREYGGATTSGLEKGSAAGNVRLRAGRWVKTERTAIDGWTGKADARNAVPT